MDKLNFLKKINWNKNTILIGVAVLAIIIVGVLILERSYDKFSLFGPSAEEIGQQAINYINDNQLSFEPAVLVSVSKESGVVKVKLKIGANEIDSYATKDGKFLFPQALDMSSQDNNSQNSDNNSAQTPPAEIVKTDSPMLEAFIVSGCPYGIQMQRMIADAVENIPSLDQYIRVEYIGDVNNGEVTSMHGNNEAVENLRQICIREEQPLKYWDYVSCYIKAGDARGCETSSGVNSTGLNACISDANRGVVFAQKDFDSNYKYNISGSPTLILGGVQVSEFDFGGRTSDAVKSLVCAGFSSEPSFCSTQLNTSSAAVSFSETYAGSASNNNDASCGG